MRRLLLEALITELAENQGISIDEAVALRVEQAIAATPRQVEVTVRPIEPQGKLIGFASVNFGGVVVDDFKVVNGKNGVFLGAPSKPDAAEGYSVAVEKLIARAEAVRPAPIREQLEKAAAAAAKENAGRTAPAKGKEARDDR